MHSSYKILFFPNQTLTGGPFPKYETYAEFPFSPFCPGFPYEEKKSILKHYDPLIDILCFYTD